LCVPGNLWIDRLGWRGWIDQNKRPTAMGLAYFTAAICAGKMADADDCAAAPVGPKKDPVEQVHFPILQVPPQSITQWVSHWFDQ